MKTIKIEFNGESFEIPEGLKNQIEGAARSDERTKAKAFQKSILKELGVEDPQGSVRELAENLSAIVADMKGQIDSLSQVQKKNETGAQGQQNQPGQPGAEFVSKADLQLMIDKAVAEKERALSDEFKQKARSGRVDSIVNDIRAAAIASGLKPAYREAYVDLLKKAVEFDIDDEKTDFFVNKDNKKVLLNSIDEVESFVKSSFPDLYENPKRGFPESQNGKAAVGVNGSRYQTEDWAKKSGSELLDEGINEELSFMKGNMS